MYIYTYAVHIKNLYIYFKNIKCLIIKKRNIIYMFYKQI
jgi:hypothetical protein